MPNINLRDNRKRDAEVRAEHVGQTSEVRYIDANGETVATRKVLKATMEQSLERLIQQAGELDKVGDLIAKEDRDVDIERAGMFLSGTNRVFVNEKGEMVHNIAQTEIVRGPDGTERERRPRHRAEPNVDGEIPISWTGRLIKKDEALRRFVFSSKLQIVHVNGLTYDFLYGMAKELAQAGSLMLLGAGKSGRDPLIFRRGMTPHRGFLEGRVDGDKYILLLHLSKLELKRPAPVEQAAATEAVATAATDIAAATRPPQQPTAPATVTVPTPPAQPEMPSTPAEPPAASATSAKEPQKPTVAEIIGREVVAAAEPAPNAKTELTEQVATAKAKTTRKKKDAVAGKNSGDSEPRDTASAAPADSAGPATKKRAPRAKPASEIKPAK